MPEAAAEDDAGIGRSEVARESDAVLARRAQILSTEHWGLLSARGTAQSEVLTRITIFLTLVSAALVTIGLLGQASDFSAWFPVASLSILAFVVVVGLITQARVLNVAQDDMMFVTAMNRLRGAYVELDPAVEKYFLEATTDDHLGMRVTYSFMAPRGTASQMGGSSAFLIVVVNACVVGLLGGGALSVAGIHVGWAIAIGILIALLYVFVTGWFVNHTYLEIWRRYTPRRTMDALPDNLLSPRARRRSSG